MDATAKHATWQLIGGPQDGNRVTVPVCEDGWPRSGYGTVQAGVHTYYFVPHWNGAHSHAFIHVPLIYAMQAEGWM